MPAAASGSSSRDRDPRFTAAFGNGLHRPRRYARHQCKHREPTRSPNALVDTFRRELLDRVLIIDQRYATVVLREFEQHYNSHRPHRARCQARSLGPLPQPSTAEPTAFNDATSSVG
jgi:hypothetical protein